MLKQVEETGLYKHVTNILSSEKSSCQIKQTIGLRDSLPNIAASVCCQGAGFLTGKLGLADRFCCRETGVRCYMANGDKPVTVVSGTVVNSNGEQGVDIVVPLSQKEPNCCSVGSCGYSIVHPASNNILTALLLALPPQTWMSIKDYQVLQDMSGLVSTEKLPHLLQEEVPISLIFSQMNYIPNFS